ncbi:FixH family protein [Bacillus sp. USDA818B3_A]|uniref:FixH family protein n=1 Tax=Bacillus sp. USDA818B3_A TaxID=2698834 RepID=UPI00136BAABF|nr:FixH family protein [Bacillus sp. USDA818B3_A]
MNNKVIRLIICLLFVLLAGCSANSYDLKLSTPKSFTPGQTTPIQLKILDQNGKAVEGAKVAAILDMNGMSHGDLSVAMQETENGVYVGNVKFEMEGDYTAIIQIDKNGEKTKTEKRFSIVYNNDAQ